MKFELSPELEQRLENLLQQNHIATLVEELTGKTIQFQALEDQKKELANNILLEVMDTYITGKKQ
jgi:hypothetical protein